MMPRFDEGKMCTYVRGFRHVGTFDFDKKWTCTDNACEVESGTGGNFFQKKAIQNNQGRTKPRVTSTSCTYNTFHLGSLW